MTLSHAHAVIMAGGSGTRFWPASRHNRPKQLLDIWGEPLLRATAVRLAPVVPFENQWIITGAHLVDEVRALIPEIPAAQVIAEPVGRNTAPCVGLAATLIDKIHGGEARIGVFPADHVISDEAAWQDCLERAYAAAGDGPIVTLGVRPTRPETGYGYIHHEGDADAHGAHPVASFREKPDRETARAYLDDGDYLWNAGIFIFEAQTMLGEIQRQLPELAASLERLRDAWGAPDWSARFSDIFHAITGVSIDYGVMEGAEAVRVVPASFVWSDVGHWGALHEVLPADDDDNIAHGPVLGIDNTRSVLVNTNKEGRLLVGLGLEDIVVVDTPDALLVCPRDRVQDVRAVVDALKANGPEELL